MRSENVVISEVNHSEMLNVAVKLTMIHFTNQNIFTSHLFIPIVLTIQQTSFY